MKQLSKNKQRVFLLVAIPVLCLIVGLLIAFLLYKLDYAEDHPVPISGGQTVDLSSFGFQLRVPEDYTVSDMTEGSGAFITLAIGNAWDQFYIYCYRNDSHDDIEDYSAVSMVRYYMESGCDQVRTRSFGGRTFVSYRAAVETLAGDDYWYVYETWDPELHLVIETKIFPGAFLPILATFTFSPVYES